MQKKLPLRRLLACLLLSASPLTITACQLTKAPAYDTSSSAPHVESDTSEAALRAYYEALIADLRQSLLDEKQAMWAEFTEKVNAVMKPMTPSEV